MQPSSFPPHHWQIQKIVDSLTSIIQSISSSCIIHIYKMHLIFKIQQKIIIYLPAMLSIKSQVLRCKSMNEVQKLCCNQECRFSALCCRKRSCLECFQGHAGCLFMQASQLAKIGQNKFKLEEGVLDSMFKMEDRFINKLKLTRKQLKGQYRGISSVLNSKTSRSINNPYGINSHQQLTAKDINKIINSLSMAQAQRKREACLKEYEKLVERLINDLVVLRERLYEKFISNESPHNFQGRIEQQDSMSESLAVETPQIGEITIDSQILQGDYQGYSKFKYLMLELGNPTSLRLLFRASEHNFQSERFHIHCDGIKDTLAIVKNQFGKTIAGFTRLPWDTSNSYTKDPALGSFLLQLEWRQRMNLQFKTRATFNHIGYGPTFGKDLVILDKGNQSGQNSSNFPYNYNYIHKYEYDQQQNWTAFCGAPSGNKFRVIEYEVFQVIQ